MNIFIIKFHGYTVVKYTHSPARTGKQRFWGMNSICVAPRTEGQPSLQLVYTNSLSVLKYRSLSNLVHMDIIISMCVLLVNHLLYCKEELLFPITWSMKNSILGPSRKLAMIKTYLNNNYLNACTFEKNISHSNCSFAQ